MRCRPPMAISDLTVQAAKVLTHARVEGEGVPPLVLLHGAEADAAMWDPYMGELALRRRVYALDLPGSGSSEPAADADCSPGGLAGWLGAFLDAEGHRRCDLMGHSLGGSIALRVAAHSPERVRRLIAVSPAHLAPAVPAFAEAAEELLVSVAAGTAEEPRVRALLAKAYRRKETAPAIREGARYWMRPGVGLFLRNGGVEAATRIPPEMLASLAVPTMVVWGSRDRSFPVAGAREAVELVPGCRFVVLEGAGHSPFEEARAMFMLMLEGFLEGPHAGE